MRTFAQKQNQPRQESSARLTRPNALAPAASQETHPLLDLQRTIGNQALLRLLKASADGLETGARTDVSPTAEGRSETPTTTRFAHDFSRIPVHGPAPITIQPKLAVNTPGDSYEQEADHVAEELMRMPEPQLQRACACGNHTMAGDECSEGSKKSRSGRLTKLKVSEPGDVYEQEADRIADQVMATSAHHGASGAPSHIQRLARQPIGHADATPASVDQALATPGRPLEPAVLQDMEQRFGHDFSRVRVHSGAIAEQSAQEVNANAYTVGHNMVFGAGRFAPETYEGRKLIAHELTHVVQQTGSNGIRPGQANDKRGLSPISHMVAAGGGIWRQRAGTMTDADRREFVRDATAHFTRAAQHYATHAVDAATFEHVINAWYALLANREELIKDLGGDAILTRELQAAYTNAIRALMKQAAVLFNRPQADLYRENTGRIPVWAWLQPHHMESGMLPISTPIPDSSSSPDPFTGEVKLHVNGFDVTIMPDGRDPTLSGAETRITLIPGSIHTIPNASRTAVSDFTVPTPAATIKTFFGPGMTDRTTAGSGRGTTKEDIAGGSVTPHSISLGFHEGHHGLDFLEFLSSHPPPTFTGAKDQTNRQFNDAIRRWNAAWAALNAEVNRFSKRRTDCVGTTIDDFNRAQGGGARFTLVCGP